MSRASGQSTSGPRAKGSEPTFILDAGFHQLLALFTFVRFHDPPSDKAELAFKAWEKTIDVQQHFNELEMTIRNFAITLFAGVVGAIFLCVKDGLEIQLEILTLSVTIPVATLVGFVGAGAWLMFYVMDQHWYHVFLKAAGVSCQEHRGALGCAVSGDRTRIPGSRRPAPSRCRDGQSASRRTWTSTQRLRGFYYVGADRARPARTGRVGRGGRKRSPSLS